MIRILLADYHPIVRDRVKQVISETPDMEVSDEVSTAQEMFTKVRGYHYDLIIVDIDIILDTDIPGRNWLDTLKDIRTQNPLLPLLILSMYPGKQYAKLTLKAGASGYLTTENVPAELVEAIRKLVQGKKHLNSSLENK